METCAFCKQPIRSRSPFYDGRGRYWHVKCFEAYVRAARLKP